MPNPLDVVRLIIPLVAGIVLGYFLRNKKILNLNKVVSGTILVLVFSLGFTIGSNNDLLAVMPHVGLSAIVLLSTTLLFSIIFAKVARKLMKI
ncbi:MAG: LysO family transporter [Candidatus Bathyarchaeia archaeon]